MMPSALQTGRRYWWLLVLVVALAAAGVFAAVGLPRHTSYHGDARVGVADDLTQGAGQQLAQQYEAVSGQKLQGAGRLGVVTVNWHAEDRPDSRCETQLLITAPAGWQLIDWTPVDHVDNATIVGVDDIFSKRPDLRSAALFVLPADRAGKFAAAWRYAQGDPAFSRVTAHIAQRCGNLASVGAITDLPTIAS